MSTKNRFEFDNLFKSIDNSDFKFIVQSKQAEQIQIPAHKIILSSRSAYFKRIFSDRSTKVDSMQIADTTMEAFVEFLQIFYLNEICLTSEHLAAVRHLINKFETLNLWLIGEAFINGIAIRQVTIKYYHVTLWHKKPESLTKRLWNTLITNSCETNKSTFIKNILYANDLWENHEASLYYKLVTFSEAEQDRQRFFYSKNILYDLTRKYLKRFPSISFDELVAVYYAWVIIPQRFYGKILNHLRKGTPLIVPPARNALPNMQTYLASVEQYTQRRLQNGETSMVRIRCLNGLTFAGTVKLHLRYVMLWRRIQDIIEITIENAVGEVTQLVRDKISVELMETDCAEIKLKFNCLVPRTCVELLPWGRARPPMVLGDDLPTNISIESDRNIFIEAIQLIRAPQ